MLFCRLLISFKINGFDMFFQEYHQSVKQNRPDVMSGLIWVKTICKGYQHTSHVGKDLTYEFDMLYYKQINVFDFCFSAVPLYDSSYFNGFTRGMENYMYWLYPDQD